jgi:hypothetical protein
MPRIPAIKMKSPGRVPRSHVPVGLIAPAGANVLTPFGESCCAGAELTAALMIAATESAGLLIPPSMYDSTSGAL